MRRGPDWTRPTSTRWCACPSSPEVTRYSKGVWSSGAPPLPRGGSSRSTCPVPPLDEQRAIVSRIARETGNLEIVRAATERTVALLRERRSALIAAVVTGKLEVPRNDA